MLISKICGAAAVAILSLSPARAQGTGASGGPAVQITVTAEAHSGEPPALRQDDIRVTSGKTQLQILDWQPAANSAQPLQLFVLMDDGANPSIGTEFPALKQFFAELPANALVGLGYMRNGSVQRVQDLTADHALLSSKLRLPIGEPGASASPYFALQDLVKHWPVTEGEGAPRREVLMITDGVDRYYGRGPDNPYVQAALTDALRKGVIVSSIYWSSVGHFGHTYSLINWGQSYLSEVAEATGGEAYWQGFGNPVSFTPYLQQFVNRLNHQYLLTFRAAPHAKAGLEPVRVSTELRGVDVVGPSEVWVP